MVICHGLFGSRQNWRSLGKALSLKIHGPVIIVDLRNHGTSPWSEHMDFPRMAQDVQRTLDEIRMQGKYSDIGMGKMVTFVGHSLVRGKPDRLVTPY